MPELHPALCDELLLFFLFLSTCPQEVMFGEARFGAEAKYLDHGGIINKRLRFDAAVAKF